ncbi:UbiA family prenyltransferase [Thioalkalivibrio thiocyanodenitrificans]|uniref:UbiA family prenyltransferase n=1 Tax=Thioalkalivibrio thiocyanodenitrificans TaxID=243063 RepID=UPI00037B284E|nr:UbiA family prenyltransferase [Thioalkalivibrio thiocyanodenitrificans]
MIEQPDFQQNDSSQEPVLAVDLDGTLVKTDTLVEAVLSLVRARPSALAGASAALTRGRAGFKAWIADQVLPDVDSLPLNTTLIQWLRTQRSANRTLLLVTAADRRIADAVAARIGLFDGVLATDNGRNLKGERKAAALVSRFGTGGFDYAGDARTDIPVWRAARRAIVVGGPSLQKAAARVAEVAHVIPHDPPRVPAVLRALRPHQWVKNLLVFVPLIAAHQLTHGPDLLSATLAFLIFGLAASSVYLLNDLLDLPADRRHPGKRGRPFASGDLPLVWGLLLAPILLCTAVILSLLFLPISFILVLSGYLVLNAAYTLALKQVAIVDVILLAALYTIRIIAGAAAVAIPPSYWLLAFSAFIFLSLALCKRYTELLQLARRGELRAAGRGWTVDDLPLVRWLGISSGLACVLVLALYIHSTPALALYAVPEALWLICPLLIYWLIRLWLKTHRGEMHDDPVVFALKDRASVLSGALIAGIVMLAATGVSI